jgi:mRNA-degrading endonuclease toxin of MazEF toxin-antitoxin module
MTGSREKERPMLVASDDAFNRNESYPKVMVVAITTIPRVMLAQIDRALAVALSLPLPS